MRCCASIRRATGSIARNDIARTARRGSRAAARRAQEPDERAAQSARELDRRLDALDDVPKQVEELMLSRRRAARPRRRSGTRLVARRGDVPARARAAPPRARSRRARRRSSRSNPPMLALHRCAIRQSRRCGSRSHASCRHCARCDSPTRRRPRATRERGRTGRASAGQGHPGDRAPHDRSLRRLPEGMLARAWAMARNTLANLIVVRKVDDRAAAS